MIRAPNQTTEGAVIDAHRFFGKLADDVGVERKARAQWRRRGLVTLACLIAGGLAGFALELGLGQFPQHRLFLQPNLPHSSGPSYAFFEFAPSSGAGMGATCACTTPTGAKGEALTFTRASSGTCLKGNTLTGIANGDLVTCSTDQPRVMPGGAGTGGNGLLIEATKTNDRLRSEELENAAYTLANGGAAGNIVVTADATNGPCGTPGASCGMAERLQVPATTTGQYSILHQNQPLVGTWSCGVFFKGVSGSGEVGIAVYDNTTGGGMYQCARCSYVAGSWSLCKKENVISGGINATFWIGNGTSLCNDGDHAAADVYAWGVQCGLGPFLTSYIRTTSAAVTRADELADVAVAFGAGTTGGSIAATVAGAPTYSLLGTNPTLIPVVGTGAPGSATGSAAYWYTYNDSTNVLATQYADPGAQTFLSALATGSLTGGRFAAFHTGSVLNGCVNGTCGAGTAATWGPPAFTRIRIGTYATTQGYNFGVTKQVCLDPSPSRCR